MKLRSLSIHGFKSFADATVIEFHEGITAVVGPNGCGKSNISDAIRWVLGEQRPSAIRGGKMEEAIFQGSLNRRPVNRGAVTLVVSNEDGGLPVSFEEVAIGRTVYRDGGSDYSLNRSTCRLRDVLDVCRGTGLGANAYSVIENRMIDAILSDRAEERRQLFEEASGIGKYKDRRKAAMRRLEHAERDLTRLEDVIGEVETKVRSLARQKGKAERYKILRERRLAVEVSVVSHDLGALRERLSDLDEALDGDRKTGQGMVAELRTAEARVETFRLEEVDAERSRSEAAETLDRIRGHLVQWERDLAVAEEGKGYAERRLGQIGGDREASETRLRGVVDELTALDARHGGGAEELERIREDAKGHTEVVASVRVRLEEGTCSPGRNGAPRPRRSPEWGSTRGCCRFGGGPGRGTRATPPTHRYRAEGGIRRPLRSRVTGRPVHRTHRRTRERGGGGQRPVGFRAGRPGRRESLARNGEASRTAGGASRARHRGGGDRLGGPRSGAGRDRSGGEGGSRAWRDGCGRAVGELRRGSSRVGLCGGGVLGDAGEGAGRKGQPGRQ